MTAYQMRSGVLYDGDRPLAQIKGTLCGQDKRVLSPEGGLLLQTEIAWQEEADAGEAPAHTYRMMTPDGEELASASPRYANGESPALSGWPLCRMPRSDHALLSFRGAVYVLLMQNNQNYQLLNGENDPVIQILHRGLAGGWRVETIGSFSADFLCGLFVFCRYLERENELPMV